jgi:NAD+ kinase
MRSVGVVVRSDKGHAEKVVDAVVSRFAARGLEAARIDALEVPVGVEALIGVGGDGTVLRAAGLALAANLPLAGINVGRVGYLAEFEVDEIDALATAIAADELDVAERMTVEVQAGGGRRLAVNDVVVEKVLSQRVVEIGVSINGHHFARYRTDGIIVATPVGSTAYSLSAGGPVVDPELEALILTPVAPHSLLSRSIVVAADAEVRLTVEIDRPARVNVDGSEMTIVPPGGEVVVTRGDVPVRFLTLGRHPFPQAVRHQFGLDHA